MLAEAGMNIERSIGVASIGELIERSASLWPQAEALIVEDERVCYAELFSSCKRVSRSLAGQGLRAGDRIGILSSNSVDYIRMVFGASLAGLIPVLLNGSWSADYIASILPSLHLRALFAGESGGFMAIAENAIGSAKTQVALHSLPSFIQRSGDRLSAGPRPSKTSHAAIVFTAGTTGEPKACCLTHESILVKAQPFSDCVELNHASRIWLGVPMFQVGFLSPLIAAFNVGATVIGTASSDPLAIRSLLIREAVTHANPIYLHRWLPVIYGPEFKASHFRALSYLFLIGPARTLRRVQRALPQCAVLSTYGGPEGAGAYCMPRPQDPAKVRLESCGKPLAGHEIRIVGPQNGLELPRGRVGEIQARGKGIPKPCGDLDRGSSVTADGWLKTGDMGMITAKGDLVYLGRESEMLEIAGETVPASVLEAVLLEHPDIAMAQVLPIPDPVLGEGVWAFIERRPGMEITPSELIAFCQTRVSENHIPRAMTFLVDWPVSASKIQKNVLGTMVVDWRPQ